MLTIREAIKEIVRNEEEIYSLVCNVDEVDETLRTLSVTPINGDAAIHNVRLQSAIEGAAGLVLIPEVDSKCIVTFLTKDTAFASCFDAVSKVLLDCDEITFNGGDNGSLIIIQSLVDKINAIEDAHNGLVSSFNAHTHITTATISASAVPGVIAPTTSQNTDVIIDGTTVGAIENDKITH